MDGRKWKHEFREMLENCSTGVSLIGWCACKVLQSRRGKFTIETRLNKADLHLRLAISDLFWSPVLEESDQSYGRLILFFKGSDSFLLEGLKLKQMIFWSVCWPVLLPSFQLFFYVQLPLCAWTTVLVQQGVSCLGSNLQVLQHVIQGQSLKDLNSNSFKHAHKTSTDWQFLLKSSQITCSRI